MTEEIKDENSYDIVQIKSLCLSNKNIQPDEFEGFYRMIGDCNMTLNMHSHEQYTMPKSVYFQLSTAVKHLTIAFEKEEDESYNFILDNVIVMSYIDWIGKDISYTYKFHTYHCEYFSDYVIVGIPKEKFDNILTKAQEITKLSIDRDTFRKTDGYIWINAVNCSAECYIYSSGSDDLVSCGSLKETIIALNSNVIGVGHFRISVNISHDNKYFLQFRLRKFQLTNTTRESSIVKVFKKVEPPQKVMSILNSKK